MRLFLTSARYDGKRLKVDLVFYNPETQKLVNIVDATGHQPYCYTKSEYKPQLDVITSTTTKYVITKVDRYDPIADTNIRMLKITAPDPLSIGGSDTSIRNRLITWESDIKYYERYLFDKDLVCGLWYEINGSRITPEQTNIDFSEVEKRLDFGKNKEYDSFVKDWVKLLNQPVPELKRISVDIEVEYDQGKIPSVATPTKKITAIGFSSNDGLRRVNVLDEKKQFTSTNTTFYYSNERELITDSFKLFADYPFIITFNGDAFDLPYLYARCEKLCIPYREVPLTIKSTKIANGAYTDPVYIKNAIHLDLYRFFKNKSIQNYAFSHKYAEFGLDAISKGLLNEAKLTYEGSINDLSPDKLAEYCLNDADLTIKLTTFNDNLLVKLMIMICRIAKQPLDDICRYGINQWGRGMFYSEMVKRNILIPRSDELLAKGTTASQSALIKDKKYKGAFVFEPTKGVYFDVKSLDFASLYPSIIKTNNISFETINCPHQTCMINRVPETNSWACKRKSGIASMIIGSLRDLRVNYYKYMSKKEGLTDEEHQLYDIVAQTLKVIMNASYGIMGFEAFSLYCLPVAESVTSYGRNIIQKTIEKATSYGLSCIYGDTDSVYTHKPDKEKLDQIIKWTQETYKIDLEIDKTYRYLILTNLKKNYLGITDKGKPDIKGLTGKKSHTPIFIRDLFFEVLDVLCKVKNESELPTVREKMASMIKKRVDDLKANSIPFGRLAYNVVVNKDINSYGKLVSSNKVINLDGDEEILEEYKSLPQHIKAAKMLPNVEAGSVVSIIKTRDENGVKPRELVKSIDEVDVDKYVELMSNTFGQILNSFELDFKTLISGSKQLTMDEIWKLVILQEED